MNSEIIIGSGTLWAPYLNLVNVIETAVLNPTERTIERLDFELKKYKPEFQNILSTQPRSLTDREELKKAVHEPISLRGHEGKKLLPEQLVHEAFLISDMFEINELQAMDLLVTGEAEIANHPGWARGLVAVYLYFEGRDAMVSALNMMLTMCPGNAWGSTVDPRVLQICCSLLDPVLAQEDFMDKALGLLDKYDQPKLMELLEGNLALGDWRHRIKIMGFISSLREGFGRVIFNWAAQRNLSWNDVFRLLEFLRNNVRLTENFTITKELLFIIVAVLFAIENSLSGPTFNKGFASSLRKYYLNCKENTKFQCPELLEIIKLAYFEAIYKIWSERSLHTVDENSTLTLEDGQVLLTDEDMEFKSDLFGFIKDEIFSNPKLLEGEEYLMRELHQLLINFVNFMPMKLKEMKNRSEDAVKTTLIYLEQGISRPQNLPRDYENFLESLGSFYTADSTFELAADFFRSGAEFATLCKLVRSSCLDSPAMFVPNIKMFIGFAVSYTTGVFSLIKQNGHNLSLEHFFEAIAQYLSNVSGQPPVFGMSVYQSEAFNKVVNDTARLHPSEIHGLCAYLDLLRTVCSTDTIRDYFITTKRHWFHLLMNAGKARGLPLEVRSRALEAAAAMIPKEGLSQDKVEALWEMFFSVKFVAYGTSDLRDELEDKENRLESYTLTISFLRLLSGLVAIKFGNSYETSDDTAPIDNEKIVDNSLDPYVSYVKDSVLTKVIARPYTNVNERWEKAKLSLNILSNLLSDVSQIMIQMLSDSPLMKTCLILLDDCAHVREIETGPLPFVDDCCFECLTLIKRVCDLQAPYLYRRDKEGLSSVIVGVHSLLQKISGETGKPEYLISLLKFTNTFNSAKNRNLATHILAKMVSSYRSTDANLYAAVTSDPTFAAIVRHSFIKCLSDSESPDSVKKDVLKMIRSSSVHPSPNFGFFLLGIDKKIDFEKTGNQKYARSLLHAILENSTNLPGTFHTLLVLIRDARLNEPLLRYLRNYQFLVKYFLDEFAQLEMDVECMGYFFKCIAIELGSVQQPSPLAQAIVDESGKRFIDILRKLDIEAKECDMPNLEFFEVDHVSEAMKKCEYNDGELNIKLVDRKMLKAIFNDEISKLEKSTALRLKKSVQGEANGLLEYVGKHNSLRKAVAAKLFLFDCWRQCLEIVVLDKGSLALARVSFLTSALQVLINKMKVEPGHSVSEAFQRLAAETTMVLCGVLSEFGEYLSNEELRTILKDLCQVTAVEQSLRVRSILHTSILFLIKLMKGRGGMDDCSRNLTIVVNGLFNDSKDANQVGKIQAMFLLGEVIRWSTSGGLSGYLARTPSEITVSSDKKSRSIPGKTSNFEISRSRDQGHGDTYGMETGVSLEKPATSYGDNSRVLSQTQGLNIQKKTFEQTIQESVYGSHHLSEIANPTVLARSALVTHLYNRGFLKNIIDELCILDDANLTNLFQSKDNSKQMQALMVFEAKMFMLGRFACTGRDATRMLMECDLISRLTDMKILAASAAPVTADPLSTKAETVDASTDNDSPSANRVDLLFGGLFSLLLSIEKNSAKDPTIYSKIWNFLTLHDQAISAILDYPDAEKKLAGQGCLLLLTSLLARTSKFFPLVAFTQKWKMWDRMAEILSKHASTNGYSELQIKVIKNTLVFFNNYSANVNAMRDAQRLDRWKKNIIILEAKIDQDFTPRNPNEVTVGTILKIVQNAAHKLSHVTDTGASQTMLDLSSIVEVGLTLSYMQVCEILREKRPEQQKFQFDLAAFMEDGFVKLITGAREMFEDYNYVHKILIRLRHLAHSKHIKQGR